MTAWACVRLKERTSEGLPHLSGCVWMRCGLDKSLPLSVHGPRGKPQQNALSTITCSCSYTQDLNPLICAATLAYAQTATSALILGKKKKKKHSFPPPRLCLLSSPSPFVLSCFHSLLLTFLLWTHYYAYCYLSVSFLSSAITLWMFKKR